MTGQLCMYYNWDQMNLCYCSAAVTFYFLFLFVFVNCFVACIAVVPRGVMILNWACRSYSLLLCYRSRHLKIFVFSIYFFIIIFLYIYLFIF